MHYENGQIIYYLHIRKDGYMRVLKLRVELNEEDPYRSKGIILNKPWNPDRSGSFYFLHYLEDGFHSTSPVERIAELYRRKVEEVNAEIKPLMEKTLKEYGTSTNH